MKNLEDLLYEYKLLIQDIIETLDERDNFVKEWIKTRVEEIEGED